MMFYQTCRFCGAHLDPGERCECRNEEIVKKQRFMSLFESGKDGQIQIKMEDYKNERY